MTSPSSQGVSLPASISRADEIVRAGLRRTSLGPNQDQATLPSTLWRSVARAGHSSAYVAAYASGVGALVEAQRAAFPENLLWDLDSLSASLVRESRESVQPAEAIAAAFERLVRLQHLFGAGTVIRFRYIHDFAYGYDWSRWVAEDPESRGSVDPYGRVFVERMLGRGKELLALIAADDEKYPRLGDEAPRNPFGFSREPDHELQLHVELARRDLIPVRAWQPERPVYRALDFGEERVRVAHELGFSDS